MAYAKDKAPAKISSKNEAKKGPQWNAVFGRVKAAIWAQDRNGKTRHSFSLVRSYRTANGQWQRTPFMDADQDVEDFHQALDAIVTELKRIGNVSSA